MSSPAWLGNLFVFILLLYMVKTILGINFFEDCHAGEVLLGTCESIKLRK